MKSIFITGATSGIGRAAASYLAEEGHHVYLLIRNREKGEAFIDELKNEYPESNVHIIECDLADLETVKCCATQILMQHDRIDVLINNAGGIFPNQYFNKDGYEQTFVVNHLGHFLLTYLLRSLLAESNAKVINLSSEAHKAAKPDFDDVHMKSKYQSFTAYANAKLFNVYFTKSLVEQYGQHGIRSFAVHPGVVRTGFGKTYKGLVKWIIKLMRPFMITPDKGAEDTINLALDRLDAINGSYIKKGKVTEPSSLALDVKNREQLWRMSEDMVKDYLPGKDNKKA